jgi:hypothetical protein
MRALVVNHLLVVAALGVAPACVIGENDPLPGIGAPCVVSEGHCDVEHTCVPNEPGAARGVCAPIASFGICDDDEPVRHPPGRRGEDKDATEIVVDGPEDLALLEDIRSVTGQVRVFKQGADDVEIDDLCAFRALQRVGDGLAIGDSTVTTLDGLQSVTSVDKGLAIFDNPELVNLDGLLDLVDVTERQVGDNLEFDFDVIIAGNRKLPDDVVDDFVNGLKARTGKDLNVVACNNTIGGRPCSTEDARLLGFLISNGI